MMHKNRKTAWQKQFCQAAGVVCASLTMWGASAFLTSSPVQALAGDLATIRGASNLDGDPQDAQAVATVCTVCHASFQFLSTPRSSNRWEQVFEQMSGYGATGTDDQLDRVVAYFQKNLTVINVNTSPPEDLQPTLQLSAAVTAAIMARRTQHPFTGIEDLSKISGVDRSVLEKLNAKSCLQF
jgi:competence protein ComEA